tara:strand:- start:1308 stop:1925 length:618 start_codon:yes stop_codon:yes gene_type:complete
MIAQQEKKIDYNPEFWNIGKKTRKNSAKKKATPEREENAFDTDFSNQLSHLTSLMNTNNSNPMYPTWGNLKNGTLPTYRTFMNNNNPQVSTNINQAHEQNQPPIQPTVCEDNKSKYFLGKNKNKRTTKVRIQGKKSRRKVKKYIRELEQQPITDIKNELYNNCLIKCGGNTPVDVLKEMYKASKLSGGIKNKNGDILLHNFFSND